MTRNPDSTQNANSEPEWLAACAAERIDPQEVRLIYDRFAAYRDFTQQNTGSAIAIEQWFRFYHLEKNSEGLQAGAPVAGCSADGDAVNNACLLRPAEFLRVLRALDAHTAAEHRTNGSG